MLNINKGWTRYAVDEPPTYRRDQSSIKRLSHGTAAGKEEPSCSSQATLQLFLQHLEGYKPVMGINVLAQPITGPQMCVCVSIDRQQAKISPFTSLV